MSDIDANMDEFFDVAGLWTEKPLTWDTPEKILNHKQFLGVLQQVTGQISLAFMMSDVHETVN